MFRKAIEAAVDLNRRLVAGRPADTPEEDMDDTDTVGGAPLGRRGDALVDPLAGVDDRIGAARADALMLLAHQFLDATPAGGAGGDRYQVIIHVDADALVDDGDGRCHIQDGPALSIDVVRRLACGAHLVWVAEDGDGKPVAVSPKTKDIPTALRRAVQARDGGCVFPTGAGGTCGRPAIWSHVHHVQHRSKGGAHTTTNCRVLCSYHHHLVHEGGFGMTLDDEGNLRFTRPDGRPIPNQWPTTWDDRPPDRPDRHLQPDVSWAKANGEVLNLAACVDAVLACTGHLYHPGPPDYDPGTIDPDRRMPPGLHHLLDPNDTDYLDPHQLDIEPDRLNDILHRAQNDAACISREDWDALYDPDRLAHLYPDDLLDPDELHPDRSVDLSHP